MKHTLAIMWILLFMACEQSPMNPNVWGTTLVPGDNNDDLPGTIELSQGYFQEMDQLINDYQSQDEQQVMTWVQNEVVSRKENPGSLPQLTAKEINTLFALWDLAFYGVDYSTATPSIAKQVGLEMLSRSVRIDPLLRVQTDDISEESSYWPLLPGMNTMAQSVSWIISMLNEGASVTCNTPDLDIAIYTAGEEYEAWVEQYCEEDRWVGRVCESDTWVDGECWDEWVPEVCDPGYYQDNGYYEYFCWDEDNCYYRWREILIWIDGTCTGGYWEEYCDSGYWEDGACYGGTYIEGECVDGHNETFYKPGFWEFDESAVTPAECIDVRLSQLELLYVGIQLLKQYGLSTTSNYWEEALLALPEISGETNVEAWYSAAMQVIKGLEVE